MEDDERDTENDHDEVEATAAPRPNSTEEASCPASFAASDCYGHEEKLLQLTEKIKKLKEALAKQRRKKYALKEKKSIQEAAFA